MTLATNQLGITFMMIMCLSYGLLIINDKHVFHFNWFILFFFK